MKIHFRLVALGILALVGGCSDRSGGGAAVSEVPSKDAPAANEQGTKPRIALVMKSLANEFFSTMAKGAEQHQAANPGQYELVSSGIKDERDLGRQVALVEEMVASGVDAIVIAPADSKALVPVLRRGRCRRGGR
jgi:ribose transport system substrate-binding protein